MMANETANFKTNDLWWKMLSPGVTAAAFGIVSFLYATAFLVSFDFPSQVRDVVLFLFGGIVMAPAWAIAMDSLGRHRRNREFIQYFESLTIWTAVGFFILFALMQQTLWLVQNKEFAWTYRAQIVLYLVLACHAVLVVILILSKKTNPQLLSGISRKLLSQPIQITAFVIALSWAIALLFKFELAAGLGESFERLVFGPQFDGTAREDWLFAILISLVALLCIAFLAITEPRHRLLRPKVINFIAVLSLFVTIGVILISYFDFSLTLEVLHYLTIVGPALHLLNGGTLLVDVFSQYGPAPVVLTYLAYLSNPNTLGTAQVVAQIFNLGFYTVWLACLFRMTKYRMAALVLGFIAIGLQLASWGGGTSNINVAPSILGLRYFPTLLLVFSISLLQAPRRHSALTFVSIFLASLWSFETLVGTLGVYAGFVVLLALHDRKFARGIIDVALIAALVITALLMTSVAIWLSSGQLPRYDIYLSFFSVYNPISSFWTYPANSTFFGWVIPMLAVFLVLADAWCRILAGNRPLENVSCITHTQTNVLFYRFVPMALLVLPMAAYYAFRSIDYTLAIALLPTAALIIPGFLSLSVELLKTNGHTRLLTGIPVFVFLWLTAYTFITLTRADAPYSFVLQECRDNGRCTVEKLATNLESKLTAKDTLEPVGNFLSDRWIDIIKPKNLIKDTVAIIAKYSLEGTKVTVLLGQSIAGEMALLHSGKWQHWPISFAYTDSLVPALVRRIIEAPVSLKPGDIVIVTTGDGLSLVEMGILKRIKSEVVLCRLKITSKAVTVYSVEKTNENCVQRPLF